MRIKGEKKKSNKCLALALTLPKQAQSMMRWLGRRSSLAGRTHTNYFADPDIVPVHPYQPQPRVAWAHDSHYSLGFREQVTGELEDSWRKRQGSPTLKAGPMPWDVSPFHLPGLWNCPRESQVLPLPLSLPWVRDPSCLFTETPRGSIWASVLLEFNMTSVGQRTLSFLIAQNVSS